MCIRQRNEGFTYSLGSQVIELNGADSLVHTRDNLFHSFIPMNMKKV